MEGLDLASRVTTRERVHVGRSAGAAPHRRLRLRHQAQHPAPVRRARLPRDRRARRRRRPRRCSSSSPDGVFLSNGPGDPAAVEYAPDTIRAIAEREVPIFGICLGHQLLGLTFGGADGEDAVRPPRRKSPGARARDRPRPDHLAEPRVRGRRATSSGDPGAPALEVTHVNLNDGTVEGLRHRELPIFAVQYHPEAAPGPARRPPAVRRVHGNGPKAAGLK